MDTETVIDRKDILRVALDEEATKAFRQMAADLIRRNEYVKFHPSELVSFIMRHYVVTYFKSDIDHLVAAFFDSQAFITAKTRLAKDHDNFLEVMRQALAESKKIKSKLHRSGRTTTKSKKDSSSISKDDANL